MTPELRWDDLRPFLAVVRAGTLAGAAEVLGVNASTVQRRIGALEEALGGALFDRDPRGYSVTALGDALVASAEDVEEAVLALRRAALGHDRAVAGPVTITLPDTLLTVIAPALEALRRTCPNLHPVISDADRVLELGTEADLALRPSDAPPESAVGRRVGRVGCAVYRRVGAEHAEPPPWIAYAAGHGPAAARRWRIAQHGADPVFASVTSVRAMQAVLASTETVGLLPCHVGDRDPRLVRVGDVIDEAGTDLWLLIHADLRRSARVRAVIDVLGPVLDDAAEVLSGHGG